MWKRLKADLWPGKEGREVNRRHKKEGFDGRKKESKKKPDCEPED